MSIRFILADDHRIIRQGLRSFIDEEQSMGITAEGMKRVLFMDDEEQLRRMANQMLTRMGYEIELACDGDDALQRYKQTQKSGQPFDAVILDLTIKGGMGGKGVIKKLLEINPEVTTIAFF